MTQPWMSNDARTVPGTPLDGTGRLRLVDDAVAADDIRIKNGQDNACSAQIILVPVATSVVQTTDTTLGEGTTDTSTP